MPNVPANRFDFKHITAAGTIVVATKPAVLHTVNINKGWTGDITIYEGTASPYAGTVAVIDTANVTSLQFDTEHQVGLTAVVSGTPGDATVSYVEI